MSTPERKVLHDLYLTLFVRGRSSRGLKRPSGRAVSIALKLRTLLIVYAVLGLAAFALIHQAVFVLSAFLHALTFVLLGMSIAFAAGEMLFNDQESDILLHRPVSAQALLWAKVAVLLRMSLWLAGAFNLAGLLTTVQVAMSVGLVVASQLVPRAMAHLTRAHVGIDGWFLWVLPPAWFAGFDDSLAGTHAAFSFDLAALSIVVTGVVLWLAFGKLAADYGAGLQLMSETGGGARHLSEGGRILDWLVARPPLSWWLRRPVERASFLLCLAYLSRDRDCKLRVYPSLAPLLITPLGAFVQGSGSVNFVIAFVAALLAEAPMLVLHQLRVSQDWAAADIFHVVPLAGPVQLCSGARKAVQALFAPLVILVAGVVLWHDHGSPERLLLLLPGLIAMPVCTWLPCRNGLAVPLSQAPTGAAQAARGSLSVTVLMLGIVALGLVSLLAWQSGWLGYLLIVELVVGAILVTVMKRQAQAVRWSPLE